MGMTLEGMLEKSDPGHWRDALELCVRTRSAHLALFERNKDAYNRFYDTPEAMRANLDQADHDAVKAIESSTDHVVALDALPAARDLDFAAKAGSLGSSPRVPGEPDWVRLMRDLNALRDWRANRLDGIDVHLPPFLLVSRLPKDRPGMTELALKPWSRAMGVKPKEILERVKELEAAGLIPGLSHPSAVRGAGAAGSLASLVDRDGADFLLQEAEYAASVLPAEHFPVPEEAMAYLGTLAVTPPAP